MDELKLDKWKANFKLEIENLQIEFDSFFQTKKLDQYYDLRMDETNETLFLEITDNTLPKEIKERLISIFNATRPEDSV